MYTLKNDERPKYSHFCLCHQNRSRIFFFSYNNIKVASGCPISRAAF
jgi:hypothetical protein